METEIAFYVGQIIGFIIPGIPISLILGWALKASIEKLLLIKFRYLKAILFTLLVYVISLIIGGNILKNLNTLGMERALILASIYFLFSFLFYLLFLKTTIKKELLKNVLIISLIQFVVGFIVLFLFSLIVQVLIQ